MTPDEHAESHVEFQDVSGGLGQTLLDVAAGLTHETVSLRELLARLGEQGMLVSCAFLTLPFLVPVSIPGVSTVFGAAIILLGIGITANRVPWFPAALMRRQFSSASLIPLLDRGARLLSRFDSVVHPRLHRLTGNAIVNRVHGLVLTFSALLLIFPFGFIPLSNTLPALAILFFALGMLQRDGVFIIAGYVMTFITVVYFAALLIAALAGGQALGRLLGG